MKIVTPATPNLPLGTEKYDRRYQDQFANVLRLYFNQLRNALAELFGTAGGKYLAFPYGAFSSTQSQTVATINTPTRVSFNTEDYANGMYFVAGDGIHVENSGLYNIAFSAQVTNSDTQSHDADLWIRKNGTDIANTASVFSVQGTHGGQPGYQVVAANFYVELKGSDYIEFWWSTNSRSVELQYLPAITTPFASPGAPAIVVTLSFVSALPA